MRALFLTALMCAGLSACSAGSGGSDAPPSPSALIALTIGGLPADARPVLVLSIESPTLADIAGQAHIKGGTLNDMRAMAGEVVG